MKILISFIVVVLLGAGVFWYQKTSSSKQNNQNEPSMPSVTQGEKSNEVPPLAEESLIRIFFAEIDSGDVSTALSRLSAKHISDDSTKQAWGVQFNAMESVKVLSVEPVGEGDAHMFKVSLEVAMTPDSASAPIPYYGWDSNPSIRWVTVVSEDGLWKIDGIATGP